MAYSSDNPGGGDSENYFDDGPPKSDMKDGMDEEGLLPKSLMAGKDFKVGEEIVLKITHIGEKDFSVMYSYGDEKDKDKSSDMPEKETADMGGGGGSEMESSMY